MGKEVKTPEAQPNRMIMVEEVMDILQVSKSTAYHTMQRLNKELSSVITPNTIIAITADAGGGEKEVARGAVAEWAPSRSNGANSLTLEAYDELYNMQQSQDDRYLPAGTGTKSAIMGLFNDWGIPVGEYKGPDKPHAKTIFKAQYLSDISMSLLDDAEKHGADHYVIRAESGKAYVLPVGANEDVYCFTEDKNVTMASDKISTASLVTRVKVLGLADADGKAAPEAIVDGLTEYGIRQRIYNRSADDTLETAKAAAQAVIDEQGQPERGLSFTGADVPFIHKGDKVHLTTSTGAGLFIIKSISHNIATRSIKENLKQIIFSLVTEAEKELGGGTGKLKSAKVAAWVYDKIPDNLKPLFSAEEIQGMIDTGLEKAKEYWSKNSKAREYIESGTLPLLVGEIEATAPAAGVDVEEFVKAVGDRIGEAIVKATETPQDAEKAPDDKSPPTARSSQQRARRAPRRHKRSPSPDDMTTLNKEEPTEEKIFPWASLFCLTYKPHRFIMRARKAREGKEMTDFRVKDFAIKPVYIGSRLQGGPQYGYEIYYHAPSGKTVRLDKITYTKKDAQAYIRKTIKIAQALREKKAAEAQR